MTGNPRLRRSAAHRLLAKVTVAVMLGTPLGCSEQAGQQKSTWPAKAEVATGSNEATSSEAGPEPVDEAWDENEADSPAGLTEHHHHYFGLADSPPGRLSPAQYDRENRVIHWPALLRDKQFSEMRYPLDQLFHQAKPGNSGVNSENYEAIRKQCEAMLGILARMMHQLNSEEFVGASRFIKGLEDEARFPVD